MFKFLSRFRQEDTRQFKGGIYPPEMKTQSNGTPLTQLPLPPEIILPVKQHIGHQGEILVRIGDKVLRGQPLTFGQGKMLPVHASTSGTVTAIKPHITAHPSALPEISIFITPDGEDRWAERQRIENFRELDRQEIINRIQAAGVAGLGGAGFPTATKLRGGLPGVNTLIINAAECEPYITADDRIMQDFAEEILTGVRILGWVLQAEQIVIGIENNKPEAISALRTALGDASDLFIRVIPTKYPSGGAKQLTKILTGREVPKGGHSSDIGVLMQNVGTAYAVKRAIVDGEPLTERVVTLTGDSLTQPRNVWGRLGTPVSHLLEFAGFKPGSNPLVIMGGPLMGFTLPSLSVPVVKITNCLLAPSAEEMGHQPPEQSCIRCSACADACPAGLLPQQLYWYCQGGDHEKARAYHLNHCIECGACAWVCPSNIPLVQYYRQEKAELSAIDLEARRTAEAKARFEARQTRLEKEKLARETRHTAAKQAVTDTDKDRVSAALERVKARQHATQQEVVVGPDSATGQAQSTDDSRKAAVNAAIARVKARKTAISDTAEEPVVTADNVDRQNHARTVAVPEATKPENQRSAVDPRKAALAAAVARAKAKRAAQGSASGSVSESLPCPSDHHQAHPPSSVAEE